MRKLFSIRSMAVVVSFGASAVLVAGCSSPPDEGQPAPADAQTDATADVVADTAKDTTPPQDLGPIMCDEDLPGTWGCPKPTKVAGGNTCSDAQIDAYIAACHKPATATSSTCTKWKSENAGCATCTDRWTYKSSGRPARDYCYYQVMTPTCADAVACYFGCVTTVCSGCEGDENLECQKRSRAPGGRCYEKGYKTAESDKCFDEKTLDPCTVNEYGKAASDPAVLKAELQWFYRGACRDNAKWDGAKEPLDGGTDGGSEVGVDAAVDAATDVPVDLGTDG